MGPAARPAAEFEVTAALVRALLAEQHPDLADLPLTELASGWDNVIYRLGDDLTVRLPRRQAGAELVASEQRWLPELAPELPVPIPAPVRIGQPGEGYPWSWSVCRWLPGARAVDAPPHDPAATADVLGRFVRALHRPAPDDAPRNPVRGVPLGARSESVARWLTALDDAVAGEELRGRWAELVSVPPWPGPPVWLHGDLHPGNILVHRGRVSAVIDFGDLTAGDPATDLAVAWMLLPAPARAGFRDAAGPVDDHTWARAEGWALFFGLAIAANSADDPQFAQVGLRTLAEVLAPT